MSYKAADVGLYGIGVEGHFGSEQNPNPLLIKQRLDRLATACLPIWLSELDVQSTDENKRADFYEKVLRAFYGHPAVEGIMFWGFWDRRHWRGEKAALVKGADLQLTEAGRRVLDLLENRWMTDETFTLSYPEENFTVRGFHGNYEIQVRFQGKDVSLAMQTLTLGKDDVNVTVCVHG